MIGSTISHYKILTKLDEGGMGVVYLAEDTKLQRKVALKFIPPELDHLPETRKTLIEEAQAASSLEHTNICNIFEIGETESGQAFIVMSYYEGETLRSKIDKETLDQNSIIDISIQVLEGLTRVHESGIIHKDLKPSNIFITHRDEVKILDFGITQMAAIKKSAKDGKTFGTAAYMSPEQMKGETIDPRSDIWSFGIILYEMLTGKTPFEGGKEKATLYFTMGGESEHKLDLNINIPQGFSEILYKILEKDPDKRYQRAEEISADLQRLKKESSEAAEGAPSFGSTSSSNRSRIPLIIASAVVIIILAVASYMFWPREKELPRVIVTNFENRTGEDSLDHISKTAADYITFGLRQSGMLSIFPPEDLISFGDYLPQSERIDQLEEKLDVNIIIIGSYSKQGENLSYNVNIIESNRGIIQSLTINGPVDNEKPLEEILQKVKGVLALEINPDLIEFADRNRPIKFDALRAYSENFSHVSRAGLYGFLKAYEIDSTFHSAILGAAQTYLNFGEFSEADTILNRLNKIWDELSDIERLDFNGLQAQKKGNWISHLFNMREAAKLNPDYDLAVAQSARFSNYLQESINAYKQYVENSSDNEAWLAIRDIRIPYHMLEKHEEELEVIEHWVEIRTRAKGNIRYYQYKAAALSALGRTKEVEELVDRCFNLESRGEFTPGSAIRDAALELRAHGYKDVSHRILKKGINWYKPRVTGENRYDLAMLLYYDEQWEEAKTIIDSLIAENPDNRIYNGRLGCIYTRMGNHDEAKQKSEWLGNMEYEYRKYRPIIWQARIAALLGDKEQAVEYLRDAYKKGLSYGMSLHRDLDLESLRGYAPFEEFMQPKK
jgi:serine/threonine protein kinase